jgi:hypothetical protein
MLQYAFGEAAPKSDLSAIRLRQSYGVSSEVPGNGLRGPGSTMGLDVAGRSLTICWSMVGGWMRPAGWRPPSITFFRWVNQKTGSHRIAPNPTKSNLIQSAFAKSYGATSPPSLKSMPQQGPSRRGPSRTLLAEGHHGEADGPIKCGVRSAEIKPNPTKSDQIRALKIRMVRAALFAFVFQSQWLIAEKRSKTQGRESKSVKHSQGSSAVTDRRYRYELRSN